MSIQQEHVSFLKELKHTDPYMFRLLSTFDSKLYHIMSALLFDKNNTAICEKAFQEYTKKHGWSTQKDLKGVIKKLNRLILRAPLYVHEFTVYFTSEASLKKMLLSSKTFVPTTLKNYLSSENTTKQVTDIIITPHTPFLYIGHLNEKIDVLLPMNVPFVRLSKNVLTTHTQHFLVRNRPTMTRSLFHDFSLVSSFVPVSTGENTSKSTTSENPSKTIPKPQVQNSNSTQPPKKYIPKKYTSKKDLWRRVEKLRVYKKNRDRKKNRRTSSFPMTLDPTFTNSRSLSTSILGSLFTQSSTNPLFLSQTDSSRGQTQKHHDPQQHFTNPTLFSQIHPTQENVPQSGARLPSFEPSATSESSSGLFPLQQ